MTDLWSQAYEFVGFPKIARFSREIVITEKIDGTNAIVLVSDDGNSLIAGSRSQWIRPNADGGPDNFGFASWVKDNTTELLRLGPGRHYGEWWGSGIQRGYDLPKGEKRFSLFNVHRWADDATRPTCCHVVPTLYRGDFDQEQINSVLMALKVGGSAASPGFLKPEGIIIFHTAASIMFKKTLDKDEVPKGRPNS